MTLKRCTGTLALLFSLVILCPLSNFSQTVVPAFSLPDTVCVNAPVTITNTSTNASSYFWNFCVADVNAQPVAVNIGNPGGYLSQPVFTDIVQDNGNYYAFVVNHLPGGIVRLDFGNNLLNTPTAVFLGNISNVMNPASGSEGIQVVKSNGKWYGIVVGGAPASGPNSVPKLITIYFGTSLTNPAPTAVDWGNKGNMLQAIDLHLFQENGIWYGLTANAENNTITRLNFTNSFDNPPTGVNLGNIGNLNYPTGVYALNDNGNWRVFITNGQGNTLTRLDFGNTLLNTPSGVNLGNPGNLINAPRDITILKLCGEAVGFITNTSNSLVRLNFSSLNAAPTGTSLGNMGNLNFPHSLSKLFRVGNDIYSLITNVNNNTITRLKFSGCTGSNVPSSTLQNPAPVTYNSPGIYNINLTVDDGLPTQNSLCKQVVVVAPPAHAATRTFSVCSGTSVRLGSAVRQAAYTWSTGAVSDSITVTAPGVYWVESARFGCSARDSFIVSLPAGPSFACDSVKITGADKVCSSKDTITYTIYKSPNCTQQYVFQADNQFATVVAQTATSVRLVFRQNGTTTLRAAYSNNCKIVADSLTINVKFSPTAISMGPDISTCRDTSLLLHAGSGFNSYLWQNGTTDSTLQIRGPGTYFVTAQNLCNAVFKDTLKITSANPSAGLTVQPLTVQACVGDSVQFTASGGTSYAWLPASSFSKANAAAPRASVKNSQSFTVSISDSLCARDTTITIPVTALPAARIVLSKSNDINCTIDSAMLTATGGVSYTWLQFAYLTNAGPNSVIVKPPQTFTYTVQGKNAAGCSGKDSITVEFLMDGSQRLSVPNAFTPNGNGTNDLFRPVLAGPAKRYDFTVYNRWGQVIFKTHDPKAGWDGTFHGQPQPAGIYVYTVSAEGICNGTFYRKGTVILSR